LGGAYAQMLAAEHRNDVVGLVLVDATNPSHLTTASEVGLPPLDQGSFVVNFLTSSGMLPVAMKLGLAQTTYDKSWNDLPADVVPAMKAGEQNASPQR
jgi:hypothetical protein